MSVSRARAFLRDTFAQFGYARVPEPSREDEGQRELYFAELQRAMQACRNSIVHARSRSEMARLLDSMFREAADKVRRDRAWARQYAQHGIKDDALAEAAGRSIRDVWRDL